MGQLRSIGEAAKALGVSRDTIRRLILSGALRATRISRRVMISEAEIERACVHGVGPHAKPTYEAVER